MTAGVDAVVFFGGAAVSLGSSWVLVSRIERVGSRFGASEALLGLISALAADGPEITSAVSALLARQGAVGAGVVVGSNVFNLAALLGLGSLVAGTIALHRRVIVFQGAIALWIAASCLLTIVGVVPASIGVVLVLGVLVPYVALAAFDHSRWWQRPNPSGARRWLTRAIAEEELDLIAAVHPRRGRATDALVGGSALVVVVISSVAMEHAATSLGVRFAIPGIVVGGILLAAVTSLPNAVAAIYWARRGRGVAVLTTSLNSNTLNVAAGYLIPTVVLGVAHRSGTENLVAGWYVGLSALALCFAYRHSGLRRTTGALIVVSYVVFVVVLVVTA
jgi:cation:H+ antiporter